jgi:ketosteroid isomerase-like protein
VADEERLLRRAYAAFNARDVEGALRLMHPEVDWPNGMEGGREHGHDAVRAYWTRQFELIDSKVEPIGFSREGEGRVVVDVHQVVRDTEGKLISEGDVRHVYTLRDGLVERMEIREDQPPWPASQAR